jgi:hypothetical protein
LPSLTATDIMWPEMPDSLPPKPRLAVALLCVAASFALLWPVLTDFPVADCFSLLVKARDLSVLQLLHPDQTKYVNPYYRPAFVLVLKVMQAIAGPAGTLQHVFVALVHGLSGFLVYLLYLELTRLRRGSVAAALLFLAHPANVSTTAWTTVAYATMSGLLTALSLLLFLRFARTGRLLHATVGLAAFAVGLLASQTPYLLAPALLFLALVYRGDSSRVARPRALLASIAAVAVLTGLHWLLLERRVSGATFNPGQSPLMLPLWFARTVPAFLAGFALGGAESLPLAWAAATWLALAALVIVLARRLGRDFLGLAGLTVLGTLPYSLVSHLDRYAYFASIPASILLCSTAVRLFPATPVARAAQALALGGALVLLVTQSYRGLARWHALGVEAEAIHDSIARVKPRLGRPDQLLLVNVPAFNKWIVAYQLGYDWILPPGPRVVQWDNYFEAGRVRFAPPERTVPDDLVLLHYEGGTLVERTRDELARDKIDYPALSFPRQLVLARAPTEAAVREAIESLGGDPRTSAVLEQTLPGYGSGELAAGRILSRHGNEIEVEADGRALLVIIGLYLPPDPLGHEVGQTGRFQDLVRAVELDGKPTEIMPAFYHFLALPIPPGRHRVKFSMRGG